ncbi:HNH endonuclease [Bacillus phage BC-VP]|nr:HNH endonuclease [Bacillus phage BC-VP]
MMEAWKPVKGFEGLYMVSREGRVKGVDRVINHVRSKTGTCVYKGKMLRPKKRTDGYREVVLQKEGKRLYKMVHILVAEAFVPNDDPVNKTKVNHKDEDKSNNIAMNLEWCTTAYNNTYGTRIQRVAEKNRTGSMCKPVVATNIKTGEETVYPSLKATDLHGFQSPNVHKCCKGINKTHKGFYWKYHKEGEGKS